MTRIPEISSSSGTSVSRAFLKVFKSNLAANQASLRLDSFQVGLRAFNLAIIVLTAACLGDVLVVFCNLFNAHEFAVAQPKTIGIFQEEKPVVLGVVGLNDEGRMGTGNELDLGEGFLEVA